MKHNLYKILFNFSLASFIDENKTIQEFEIDLKTTKFQTDQIVLKFNVNNNNIIKLYNISSNEMGMLRGYRVNEVWLSNKLIKL